MTDREKLIERISGSGILCEICGENTLPYCAEALADHILANGVTLLEWHNVAEEKPPEFSTFLGHMSGEDGRRATRECCDVGTGFYFPVLNGLHSIDKWAYMPQPPQEA